MRNTGLSRTAFAISAIIFAYTPTHSMATTTVVADGIIDASGTSVGIDFLALGIPDGHYLFSTDATILSGYINAYPRYHIHAHTDRGTSLYGTSHFNEGPWPTGTAPTYVTGLHTVRWFMQAPPGTETHSDECWLPGDCGVNESVETELAILGATILVRPGSEGMRWQLTVSDSPAPLPPGVPEPSTWSMIILGLGTVGQLLRRQFHTGATLRLKRTPAGNLVKLWPALTGR